MWYSITTHHSISLVDLSQSSASYAVCVLFSSIPTSYACQGLPHTSALRLARFACRFCRATQQWNPHLQGFPSGRWPKSNGNLTLQPSGVEQWIPFSALGPNPYTEATKVLFLEKLRHDEATTYLPTYLDQFCPTTYRASKFQHLWVICYRPTKPFFYFFFFLFRLEIGTFFARQGLVWNIGNMQPWSNSP